MAIWNQIASGNLDSNSSQKLFSWKTDNFEEFSLGQAKPCQKSGDGSSPLADVRCSPLKERLRQRQVHFPQATKRG